MTTELQETYLGNGVMVSFDGYHIWLHTDGGNNPRIVLEPSVYAALVRYVENLKSEAIQKAKP